MPAMNPAEAPSPPVSAGLLRRLAAMIYDTFLLAGVLFIAGQPLPALDALAPGAWWPLVLKQLYLLGVSYAFFGWFWTHGGQTLGMKAWRLRVEHLDRASLTWPDCALRFTCAVLSLLPGALGFLWIWFGRDRLAWHDQLSRTRVVVLPKPRH
ncbi:MAG TPA: RDD family protein [Gammaproteobacteria bacterium]|nr:RDD family protein [Arenicellales bacterium]HCV21225.1 RDD family protein [Gammaproteobacteria bacterium]